MISIIISLIITTPILFYTNSSIVQRVNSKGYTETDTVKVIAISSIISISIGLFVSILISGKYKHKEKESIYIVEPVSINTPNNDTTHPANTMLNMKLI